MPTNVDRFHKDLDDLIHRGQQLRYAMQRDTMGAAKFDAVILDQFKKVKGDAKASVDVFTKSLPSFDGTYQRWYSEALALLTQLLPHRVEDFRRLYEKPKGRKSISYENYHIEDYLQGLVSEYGGEVVVDGSAAIPRFSQQLAIVEAAKARFDSSLFEIRQLVQADLFDSEIDTARELLKNKFLRAAGAIAGVVLEKHLLQVCSDHGEKVAKKNPSIADLNEILKAANVIDTAQWRFNQHLADIRNLCDHSKATDPKPGQVQDLIDGVAKVMKTVV
jgi:hypothetical protein